MRTHPNTPPMSTDYRGQVLQRLCRALDAVHTACDHLPGIICVGVAGSAAHGTVLADSDLDVDLVFKGPQPKWGEDAWGVVRDLARHLQTCDGTFRVNRFGRRFITAIHWDTTDKVHVGVDICVKWTEGATVVGFGPEGQVRSFGALRDVQQSCATAEALLDGMKQAVVVVKRHVKAHRPGIKSCHVELLSKNLVSTGILARDVQMLWALVVDAGVNMRTDGLDYGAAEMYAGHPEYLGDVLSA
jgi:hypothetical protein